MVSGRQKSRTLRRVYAKTPGGVVRLHYKPRRPAKASCANCGTALLGVANFRPNKMRGLAKTKKRPERMFGGQLCSSCSRREIISKLRSQVQ